MVLFPDHCCAPTAPHDIVYDPVEVFGVGTGFEGVISAHARWRATASDGEHLHKRITRRAARGSNGGDHPRDTTGSRNRKGQALP